MFDSIELQKEIYHWKLENFGEKVRNGHQNLLGVIEEIGELSHSVLKKQQSIRYADDEADEMMKDAIGDIFIFLMNFLSENNITFNMPKMFYDESICNERDEVNIMDIYITAYELVSLQLTIETFHSIPKTPSLIHIHSRLLVKKLIFFCACNRWNFSDIIMNTWEKVKKKKF